MKKKINIHQIKTQLKETFEEMYKNSDPVAIEDISVENLRSMLNIFDINMIKDDHVVEAAKFLRMMCQMLYQAYKLDEVSGGILGLEVMTFTLKEYTAMPPCIHVLAHTNTVLKIIVLDPDDEEERAIRLYACLIKPKTHEIVKVESTFLPLSSITNIRTEIVEDFERNDKITGVPLPPDPQLLRLIFEMRDYRMMDTTITTVDCYTHDAIHWQEAFSRLQDIVKGASNDTTKH